MHIQKVNIKNFKTFKDFTVLLNDGINILVGDNEAGKSTILEAINIALTGLLNGKYLKNELSQYLFNNDAVNEYILSLETDKPLELPKIIIEIYFDGNDINSLFCGRNNIHKDDACGLYYKIEFDEQYKDEYESYIQTENITTLPIEYYKITWESFAYQTITSRGIPIKSALIDSSNNRYQNGSDVYISRIIHNLLDAKEIVDISQAHRKMQEKFMGEDAIKSINAKINSTTPISDKTIELSVDFSSKNAWENSLLTYLDNVPFHQIGKGEQCIVKTRLALENKKSKEAKIILLEEPENHLSHSKLNQLIYDIKENYKDKQIIISTHNSFVANKLGIENLILLNNQETTRFIDLTPGTKSFFEKIPGYDTLRLILCKKAILVEGDSDELIVQKAYMINNNGKIPIHDGIDVISVGTAFLRFLEIAKKIYKPVVVVTDSDIKSLKEKYSEYIEAGSNTRDFIKICYDDQEDSGELVLGKNKDKAFNYNTLEPKLVKANFYNLDLFNKIFDVKYTEIDGLHRYMKSNKTNCAIKIFDTDEKVKFPQYILDAIN
jgi:putative ATP-dependent endonuclease of OLD family